MLKKLSSLFILLLLISACEKLETKKGAGKFGMLDTDVPEFAAIEFFNQIYHTKDLSGALKLSTPKMQRLLRSYHTNKGVQRHVLNMRFDKVNIQPSTRSAGRNEFAKDAKISLFFEGDLDGNILKDLRIVSMIRVKKEWLVDDVSAE
ncbi:hypothetical protein RS130_15775 [Paraglaciecola aquimarina]|uniref:Lipoprotein n=1 Tax=Paraglaciecola aquimarina TaxID=1235557 RepID=A0ABU3SYS6_9ALTE|nr:hypothetical protein [Paraglaciecola aquimarina]MDU0355166.1 hypothetical protein [Paraglaciecola aquimarina]